ncbi:MAG: hypothetical protein KIT70_09320 [Anaerolineales bacterium]|nr:MAG: hypothetical protein KIT70_09320 [Anaerolineales bacterium]
MPAKKSTKSTSGFTAEERAAMKERARELKAQEKYGNDKAKSEKDMLAAIAKLSPKDRAIATRLHEIVMKLEPDLLPKTWYGMPGYATKDGKNIFFFQPADKFGTRYATLGFSELAKLDDGNLWANAFALLKITPAEEAKIIKLVKKALS